MVLSGAVGSLHQHSLKHSHMVDVMCLCLTNPEYKRHPPCPTPISYMYSSENRHVEQPLVSKDNVVSLGYIYESWPMTSALLRQSAFQATISRCLFPYRGLRSQFAYASPLLLSAHSTPLHVVRRGMHCILSQHPI
jgi:hypothetical protein